MDFNFGYDSKGLDQFSDDELEEGGGLPYCQVINPPSGMTSAQIVKKNPAYGLIIPKEQAELIGFTPDKNWVETVAEVNNSKDETIEVDGYLTKNPIFLVVRRSQLEVQGKTDDNWRYLGVGYSKGKKTEFAQMVDDDTSNPPEYRYVVRYILLFLGEDGKPLHSEPVALTGKGGFGGSFGKEVSTYIKDVEQAYCRHNKTRKRFSDFAQSFIVHQHTYGFAKSEGKMAFTCVESRIAPTLDESKVGSTAEVSRQDRKVALNAVHLSQLIVPKQCELGKLASTIFSENESFSLPGRGYGDDSNRVAEALFEAVGVVENPQFQTSGNVDAMFIYSDSGVSKQQKIVIPPGQAEILDSPGDYKVSGVMTAGLVIVQSYEFVGGEAVAVGASSDQSELF